MTAERKTTKEIVEDCVRTVHDFKEGYIVWKCTPKEVSKVWLSEEFVQRDYVKKEDLRKWVVKRRACLNSIPEGWSLDVLEKEMKL